ncbi:fimbrial protein [Orbus wheelerorum]|uniref:fimbrial protein n=1 Tax=Orbus wheelerorum TaxID=3074111 RepID=UPI00370D851E
MIKRKQRMNRLLLSLLAVFSVPMPAAGVGYDSNPSSITTQVTAFYAPTPTLLASVTPSGGQACSLSSAENGFTSVSSKWRSPSIAGTFSSGGYTYQIQRTNISGVGVVARLGATFDGGANSSLAQVIGPEYKTIATTGVSSAQVDLGDKYWGLVTIPGDPLIPGTYELGQAETMTDVWCQSDDASNDSHGGSYLSGQVVIDSPTCYFGPEVSSVINIDLGQHLMADVRSLGVNRNFGSATKSLSMACQAGSWPKLTISDKNNSSNNSDIITLTDPSGARTAQGFGVQVFLNNQSTAQKLATQLNLTPSALSSDSTINLPIEFKYIKTSTEFSSGEANAIVDFTFTYN